LLVHVGCHDEIPNRHQTEWDVDDEKAGHRYRRDRALRLLLFLGTVHEVRKHQDYGKTRKCNDKKGIQGTPALAAPLVPDRGQRPEHEQHHASGDIGGELNPHGLMG
jgi:hypothetical protein